MRLNGSAALTFEDARTWLEETGLCLFVPRKQSGATLAPSFVEAVAGQRNDAPGARQIALAEDLLVRLEKSDIALRLNLLGQPGEYPDFVVAAWVLPYIYALRGDRDWRRIPQLTGSRQVSPLAVQAYKLLEASESTIPQLRQALGREVSESAVLRAIIELWQQLRIVPVTEAPGKTPRWQLLRTRFQRAIAEGASTSQVTAISVLASIYLQAVIAASMEDIEMFLAPLTARSKVREVVRGLVATRQVHTMAFGHAPHFYVAGTLPEFTQTPAIYAGSGMVSSGYFRGSYGREPEVEEPSISLAASAGRATHNSAEARVAPREPAASKPAAARPHFSRPAVSARDRKPAQSANGSGTRRASAHATAHGPKHGPKHGSSHGRVRNGNSSAHGTARRNGAHSAAKPAHRAHAGGAARTAAAGSHGVKVSASRTASSSRIKRATVKTGPASRRVHLRAVAAGAKRRSAAPQRTKKRG